MQLFALLNPFELTRTLRVKPQSAVVSTEAPSIPPQASEIVHVHSTGTLATSTSEKDNNLPQVFAVASF